MPKRANGDGSIYQRKDGTWRVRVTVGRDTGTGKPLYNDSYHKTQKAAREHLRQITAALDKGTYQAPSRMTVNEWLDVWQAEYLGGVKPNTRYDYGRVIANYITPTLGAVKLQAYARMRCKHATMPCCVSVGYRPRPLRMCTAYSTVH